MSAGLGLLVCAVVAIYAQTSRRVVRWLLDHDNHFNQNYKTILSTQQLLEGQQHLQNSSIVLCGCVRDQQVNIQKTIKLLESNVLPVFRDYRILVVENDSKDATRDILLAWAKRNPKVKVLGCGGDNLPRCQMNTLKSDHGSSRVRIDKMVRLRNIYLDRIERDPLLSHYDFVAVFDFDLPMKIYRQSLAAAGWYFKTRSDIKAQCANSFVVAPFGVRTYYDPYAHEDQGLKGSTQNKKNLVMWTDPSRVKGGRHPFPVISCFNGLALYRTSALKHHRYSTCPDEAGEGFICEHVGLHRSMGGVHYNPSLFALVYDWG